MVGGGGIAPPIPSPRPNHFFFLNKQVCEALLIAVAVS